jgi:hypothetical protein
MSKPFVFLSGLLALALAAGPAAAQDFGLDLSGETPADQPQQNTEEGESTGSEDPSGGMSLDLSTAPVDAADLRPRVVVLGLDTPDRAGAAAAKRWLRWLEGLARRNSQVAPGPTSQEAQQQLEGAYDTALRCEEASCFAEPAGTLDADLLVTSRLQQEGRSWVLRLWTYDRDRGVVEEDVVTGRSPKDSGFLKQSGNTLSQRLQELARPRAMLKVTANVPQAVVRVGERVLGVGNVEARLPPGEVALAVEAEGFESYTETLKLGAGETRQVEARLQLAGGPAPEGPPEEAVAVTKKSRARGGGGSGSLFTRPAFYTALAGLVAMGVGVAVGQGTRDVSNRLEDADGDGVLDVTRDEYLKARSKANLSTALVAGGGAVAGASALWLVLIPTRSEPQPSALAPAGAQGGSALHLVVGGSF